MATRVLEGWSEFDKMLGLLPKATAGNTLSRVLLKSAEPVKDTAIRLAPDDPATGAPDLRTSIEIKKGRNGRTVFSRTVEVGVYAPLVRNPKTHKPTGIWFYARALEFGQGDMPLKAYIRPATEQNADHVFDIMGDNLKVEIDKAWSRYIKRRGG